MTQRHIAEQVTGSRAIDGAGVHLVRVLGSPTVKDFDPFLMLDAFDSSNPDDYIRGFPLHPHRGIETFTYLMRGEIDHEDSLGHKGAIRDGCCQWMTAGSGILHQEMPQPTERLLGLQLWINLPRAHKMTDPKYRDLDKQDIPVLEENGASVSVVTGEYKGVQGASNGDYARIGFLEVRMRPDASWELATEAEDTVFAYLVDGAFSVDVDKELVLAKHAVLFTPGESIGLTAGPQGAHFVVAWGKALHEPVAWGGPIVMNSEEELREAFQDLEDDTFLRYKP